MQIEQLHQIKRTALCVATAWALGLGGCSHGGATGPTAPTFTSHTFALSTNLSNAAGAATILEATIQLDGTVVADSCPQADRTLVQNDDGDISGFQCTAPPVAAVPMSATGTIGPGNHTLQFEMSAQTTHGAPTPYTVAGFVLAIRLEGGTVFKTFSLPAQTASLRQGAGSITYSFSF
ncbi:MAG TPA: hypothetical protein VKY89_02830 [Thermoanaerobaculia bacterium]|jgi:hypothetical protein|nr:hypothetical protein [Thermoanaerobaculia bacterium]